MSINVSKVLIDFCYDLRCVHVVDVVYVVEILVVEMVFIATDIVYRVIQFD
jgi:hypothetical protein